MRRQLMYCVLVALLATACGVAPVSEIGQPEEIEDFQDFEFVSLDPVVMRLDEAIAKMPILQTTTVDPAWLGFIPMEGYKGYF